MSDFRIAAVVAASLAASTALTGHVSAADRAGQTVRVQPDSYQRESFFPFSLDVGDEIFREAKVYTEEYGSVEIRFDDESLMTVGPSSEVVIDDYVYSPAGDTGQAVIRLGRGVLRMISGRLPKERVSIRTPVAAIGIRGTDFTLDTQTSGFVKIWVDDGSVVATPDNAGQSFTLDAPAFAICSATTCDTSDAPEKPISFPPAPPGGFDEQEDPDEGRGGGGGGGGGGGE